MFVLNHNSVSIFNSMTLRNLLSVALAATILVTFSASASAFRSEYSVTVKDTAAHLFHVKAEFSEIDQPSLDVQLPVWSPGWYTIENYAKNIVRFTVMGASGDTLAHPMIHKSAWRIDTRRQKHITIEFDYLADLMALNQAILSSEFGYFQGTELFLEPIGHRDLPVRLHIKAPKEWTVISPLIELSPDTYLPDELTVEAQNYDELVDAPCEMGNLDVTQFNVDGKQHRLVVNPKHAYSQAEYDAFANHLEAIAIEEKKVFGELPYFQYVYFYIFRQNDTHARGGLEHLSSHVGLTPMKPDSLIRQTGLAAHEFFHCWNVKRLRPAQMWPYDYSRDDESPLLWFSEGFTNYYGLICQYRAKLMDDTTFLKSLGSAILGVQSNPASSYTSPEDASTSTWNGYDTPQACGISYYGQGEVIAAVLDVMILQATQGKARLDDVMKYMYDAQYKHGKGFTRTDFLAAVKKISGKDFTEFYNRYIAGAHPTDANTFRDVGMLFVDGKLVSDTGATTTQTALKQIWLKR